MNVSLHLIALIFIQDLECNPAFPHLIFLPAASTCKVLPAEVLFCCLLFHCPAMRLVQVLASTYCCHC